MARNLIILLSIISINLLFGCSDNYVAHSDSYPLQQCEQTTDCPEGSACTIDGYCVLVDPVEEPVVEEEPLFIELAKLDEGLAVYQDILIYRNWRTRESQLLVPSSRRSNLNDAEPGLISLNMSNGEVNWTFNTNENISKDPVVYFNKPYNHDSVLISAANTLYSVNVSNGELDWQREFDHWISAPSATDTDLWTQETITVSSRNTVYMLNSLGEINWEHTFDSYVSEPLLWDCNESYIFVSAGNCTNLVSSLGVSTQYCGEGLRPSAVKYNSANGFYYTKVDDDKICYLRKRENFAGEISKELGCFTGSGVDEISDPTFSPEGYILYTTFDFNSRFYESSDREEYRLHVRLYTNKYDQHWSVSGSTNSITLDQWVNTPLMTKNNVIYMTGDVNKVYQIDLLEPCCCNTQSELKFEGKFFQSAPVIDKYGFLFVATTDGTIYRIDTNRWE